MDKYYFYNGFNEPKEIEVDNIILEDNYRVDLTDEFLEEHNFRKGETDEDYNNTVGASYGIFRNPTKELFKKYNKNVYGIEEETYLENF